MASKQRHGRWRHVRATRRTVRAFLAEWLAAVGDSVKPSTRQNYADYIRAYVDPIIGDRRLQDITVPVLNLLYRRLLTEGRVKVDRNSAMYAYWSEHRDRTRRAGPDPAEIVAALRGHHPRRSGRGAAVPTRAAPVDAGTGLAPKTVKNVHRMLHRAFSDAVAWEYLVSNPAEHASLPREQRRTSRNRPKPWTVDELTAWLRVALDGPVRRDVAAGRDDRDAALGAGRGGSGAARPGRAHAEHRGHPRGGRRLNDRLRRQVQQPGCG